MAKPWELVPSLTDEKLRTLADILMATRHEALRDHNPGSGDTGWGLGCRVYERSCHAIAQASEQWDWLEVLDHPLHFVFTVDGIPLRFGRGDPDDPNPRLLRRGANEQEAQQLAFEFADDPGLIEWRWRLILETDPDTLEPTRVVLVQVSGDAVVKGQWIVSGPPALLANDLPARPSEPINLGPPSVRAKRPRRDEDAAS